MISPDLILRGQAPDHAGSNWRDYLLLLLLCGLFYGAGMGSFSGFQSRHLMQMAYSAAKVPLLLLVTFFIALPSFFVLNTLLGLRDDFVAVLRALLSAQAGLTLVLCALTPFTLLWYRTSDNYNQAILFNAAMFAIASLAAQRLLRRAYRPLIQKSRRHLLLLRLWLLLYAFVGIQMAWVLRPFVGDPTAPTQFFRDNAWGNAYVNLVHIALKAAGK